MKTETAVIEMMKGYHIVKEDCLPEQENDQYYYFTKTKYPHLKSFKQINSDNDFDWKYDGEWQYTSEDQNKINLKNQQLFTEKNCWNVSEIEDIMRDGIVIKPSDVECDFCCYYDNANKQFMVHCLKNNNDKMMTLEWQYEKWEIFDQSDHTVYSFEEKLLYHIVGTGPDHLKGFEIRKIVVQYFVDENILYPFRPLSPKDGIHMEIDEYSNQKRKLIDYENYKLKNINGLFMLIIENIKEMGKYNILDNKCPIAKIVLNEMLDRNILTMEKEILSIFNVHDEIVNNLDIHMENL